MTVADASLQEALWLWLPLSVHARGMVLIDAMLPEQSGVEYCERRGGGVGGCEVNGECALTAQLRRTRLKTMPEEVHEALPEKELPADAPVSAHTPVG